MTEHSDRNQIVKLAENLEIFELEAAIAELHALFERRKNVEAKALLERLRALGVTTDLQSATLQKGKRKGGTPKYRSRSNPTLTWAGRGHLAKWLEDEMAETGKPLEHFRERDR